MMFHFFLKVMHSFSVVVVCGRATTFIVGALDACQFVETISSKKMPNQSEKVKFVLLYMIDEVRVDKTTPVKNVKTKKE